MPVLTDRPAVRRLQVISLSAAPIAGLATTLVWPQTPLDTAERLQVLAEAATRTQVAHLLNLITILLFVPALAGMHRLLQPRRPRAAAVGTGLAAAGVLGWSGVLATNAAELQIARTLSGSTAVSAAESLQSSPVSGAMLVLFLLATFSGLVALSVALWRADVVRGWVPAAVALAVVGDMLGSAVTAVVVSVWLLMAVAFTAVGRARLHDVADVHGSRTAADRVAVA